MWGRLRRYTCRGSVRRSTRGRTMGRQLDVRWCCRGCMCLSSAGPASILECRDPPVSNQLAEACRGAQGGSKEGYERTSDVSTRYERERVRRRTSFVLRAPSPSDTNLLRALRSAIPDKQSSSAVTVSLTPRVPHALYSFAHAPEHAPSHSRHRVMATVYGKVRGPGWRYSEIGTRPC